MHVKKTILALLIAAGIAPAYGQQYCLSANPNAGNTSWIPCSGAAVSPDVASPGPLSATLLLALSNANNQVVNIQVKGDSFSRVDQVNATTGPSQASKRWPDDLLVRLQADGYPLHGTGYIPLVFSFSSNAANTADADAWTVTGTHDVNNLTLGPNNGTTGTLMHLTAGSTAKFYDVRGIKWDTLNVLCATSASTTALTVSIDGGPAQPVCGGGTGSNLVAGKFSVSAGSLGAHTALFASSGDSYLYAAEGTAGTVGFSIHNTAVGSATAGNFGSGTTTQFAWDALIQPQAVVFVDQTNDAAYQVSSSTFTTAVTNIVNTERALASAPTVLLAIPPVDIVSLNYPMAQYTAAQKAVGAALNVLTLNTQDRWGTVYSSTSGLWDLSGTLWTNGGNGGVHFSDQGALDFSKMIHGALLNPQSVASTYTAPYAPGYLNGYLCNQAACTIPDDRDVVMGNSSGGTLTLPVPVNSVSMSGSSTFNGLTKRIYIVNTSSGAISIAPGSGWLFGSHTGGSSTSTPVSVASGAAVTCVTFAIGTNPQNWYCQ